MHATCSVITHEAGIMPSAEINDTHCKHADIRNIAFQCTSVNEHVNCALRSDLCESPWAAHLLWADHHDATCMQL